MLIASLDDDETWVRHRAAEELGEIGDERAVEPLIAMLDDDDAGVRSAADDALGLLSDDST